MARRARRPAASTPSAPSAPPVPGRRERAGVALFVFGVAFAVRVLHVWQIHRAPFFDLKLGDSAAYDAWARAIAGGEWLGHEAFYQAPLYPYFLGAVYSVFGSSTLAVRLVHAVLSSLSCVLIADAGWRVFSRTAGIVAGLMLAAYPPAIFLDALLQKSVLDLLLLSVTLWLISGLMSGASRRSRWWWLGVAVGALSLTRENAGVLVVPILLWLWLQRPVVPARAICGVLFACGLAVVLLPVAARNVVVSGEFFLTTSQFGPNLYIGNNERADGTYRPLQRFHENARFERQDATELAERAEGHPLTPAEVSAHYTGLVVAFVSAHPIRWLSLLGRKFALAWNATEVADTEDQYTYGDWSWPVALGSIWNLGVLAPLAVLGLWITAKEWRRLWILHAMLAAYVASVVLFYVFARYRFPVVPFLMLFGAAAVAGFGRFVRGASTRQLIGCAAALTAAAVVCNLPMVAHNKLQAATHYNHGVGFEAAGRQDDAVREYRAAIDRDPDLAGAHNDLGLILAGRGDVKEAAAELGEAVRLAPDFSKARNNLGVVLGRLGRSSDAVTQFEAAIRLDPAYTEARRNLAALRNDRAGMLARSGHLSDAAMELQAAILVAPSRFDLHNNLGIVLAQQGKLNDAAAEFERAIALNPSDPQARRNLERIR